MPVEPFKFYNPENKLSYKYVPVTQTQVSGSIGTQQLITGGYDVSGSVTSRNVCTAYDVTVTYDGPVDIGDRTVKSIRIPNFAKDDDIAQQASRATGIKEAYTGWHTLATCCAVITCTYCCFVNAIGNDVNARQRTLNNKINELADIKMAQEIAEMLKQADALVTERIKYKREQQQQQQAPIGPGNVVLSPAQFQALLGGLQQQNTPMQNAALQLERAPAVQLAAGAGKPITQQYKDQAVSDNSGSKMTKEEIIEKRAELARQKKLAA